MDGRDEQERLVYLFGFPLELRPVDGAEAEYAFALRFEIARPHASADVGAAARSPRAR